MNEQHGIGYRDVSRLSSDVSGHMNASPTGRRLALDGSLVLTYTNSNPETAYLTASEGAAWLYEDLGSGDTFVVTFTRAGGFRSVQTS